MPALRDISHRRQSATPRSWRVAAICGVMMLAACHPDMAAWRNELANPAVARLGGAWAIELRADSAAYGRAAPGHTSGTLSLALNRDRALNSAGRPPLAFGAYDIPLSDLTVSTGDDPSTPAVWVERRSDSLVITLAPEAKWPIRLAGAWNGDSIVGRWHAESEPGPAGNGNFALRRR